MLGYFLTEKNKTCLESTGTLVDDLETCRTAVDFVKKNISTARFVDEEDDGRWPKGCYLANPDTVYFNNHLSGSSNEGARQICYLKGIAQYFHVVALICI